MSSVGKSRFKINEYDIEEHVRAPIDLDIHNSIDPGWQENFLNSNKSMQEKESSVGDLYVYTDSNEDDLYFFKSIIPDLKQLPREKNVSLKLEILKLIHEKCCKKEN